MREVRVCHLVHDLALGGLENQVLRIIRATEDPSFSYLVCYVGSDSSMAPEFESAGAAVVDLDTVSSKPLLQFRPDNLVRLVRFLREERIDVLHCHGSLYQHVVGRICGNLVGTTVVGTYHNRQDSFHPAMRAVERFTRPFSAVNIAVSNGVERTFAGSSRNYEVGQPNLDRRTYTIYNGIDVGEFEARVAGADPSTVDPRENGEDGTVFLNIGRYAPMKNQVVLVEAMNRVVTDLPDAHLIVVGWGELEGTLRETVAEHGLDDHVTVTGRVPSVEEYYALADVFVLPSLSEGLSVVLLEAMAASLPIVGSRIPGTTEAILEGESGFLVSPDSPAELADAMTRLDRNDRRRQFGATGHRLVSERFEIRHTVDAYLDIYSRLAE